MRKSLAAFLAATLFTSQAHAQVGFGGMFPGPGTVHSAGGGSFSGQGDIQTYVSWLGLRAYSGAYATGLGNAIILCTALDAACTTIHVTSTGILNASDLTTSGCSAILTCTIKQWYDQTGNGHDQVQATIANRATFSSGSGCSNTGLPCASFGGSAKYLEAGSVYTQAQPMTFIWAASRTGAFTTETYVFESRGGFFNIGYFSVASFTVERFGGAGANPATDSVMHVIQALGNGASGTLATDASVSATFNGGANTLLNDHVDFAGGTSGLNPTMEFLEGGLFGGDATSTATATCHNAYLYWTTGVSC